jgi:hypothetical protein
MQWLQEFDADADGQASSEALALARDEGHREVELDAEGVEAGVSTLTSCKTYR